MGRPALTPSEVVLGYLESFSTADPDLIASWVTEDFVNEHTSSLGTGCTGRAAYRERLPGFLATFEGLGYHVERTIAEGDRVAVCYRLTATNQGSPVEIPGVMVFELRDGLVAHRTDYWDSLTFLRQTGQA